MLSKEIYCIAGDQSDDLTLRPYSEDDHQRTFDWLQYPEMRKMTGTTAAPTPEGHWRWFNAMRARTDVEMLAIYYKNSHVGNFYFVNIDIVNNSAEIQMFIGPQEVRGKGIGKEVIRKLVDYAFSTLKLNRLYGWPFAFNERSIRMLQANGFRVEGTMRQHRKVGDQYCDVLVVGLLASDLK